jgi:hypothetical protein
MFIWRANPWRDVFGALLPNLQDALFTLRRDDEPDYEPLMHGGAAESLFVIRRVKKSIRWIIQIARQIVHLKKSRERILEAGCCI